MEDAGEYHAYTHQQPQQPATFWVKNDAVKHRGSILAVVAVFVKGVKTKQKPPMQGGLVSVIVGKSNYEICPN